MDTIRTRARVNGTTPRVKPMRDVPRPPRRLGHATDRRRAADSSVPSQGAAADRARERELLALQIVRARHRAT